MTSHLAWKIAGTVTCTCRWPVLEHIGPYRTPTCRHCLKRIVLDAVELVDLVLAEADRRAL